VVVSIMRMPNLFRIARVPLQPKASVSESLKCVRLIYCATDSSPTTSPLAIQTRHGKVILIKTGIT